MHYALLIYQAERIAENYSDEETEAALAGHRALQADAKAAGRFVEANQLMPPSSATTLRKRGEKVSITDGPFTESKELLIGFYVLECDSLDRAIAYAARIPHAETGAIEIRPIAYLETDEGVKFAPR